MIDSNIDADTDAMCGSRSAALVCRVLAVAAPGARDRAVRVPEDRSTEGRRVLRAWDGPMTAAYLLARGNLRYAHTLYGSCYLYFNFLLRALGPHGYTAQSARLGREGGGRGGLRRGQFAK